ncbi:MAG: hypothetical protein K2Q27_05305 [Novosphingobium sp.]|nr:hypothetical protein [Novosphingobium sp.]
MTYSEASYFAEAHFAHIADWERERMLAERRRRDLELMARAPMRAKRGQDGLVGLSLFEPRLI